MGVEYERARKLGKRQLQRDIAAGRYPYPPALDDLLKGHGYQGEVSVGNLEIAPSLIVGTKTRGRQNAFSRDFLPLPHENSEFAAKWSNVLAYQQDQGIGDPIEVYEYLQRFYVQEGNKRVSVARYLDMPAIPAHVTRVVPLASDDPAVRVYFEFMQFYAVAPVYGIEFSREGGYARLAALAGETLDVPWPEEKVRALAATLARFRKAFVRHGGEHLGVSVGEALLMCFQVYGFGAVTIASSSRMDELVDRIWGELVVMSREGGIAYLEEPAREAEESAAEAPSAASPASGGITNLAQSMTERVVSTVTGVQPARRLFRLAFIYDGTPQTSGWIALHEQGRMTLELQMAGEVSTTAFMDRASDERFDQAVEEAIASGAGLIATVSPTQMSQTLRAALKHPECRFINCSVSLSHSAVRTYSGRLYEAKFILGALAASMADNHRVGYVADTPVYNAVAEVNAFAIGAALVDPYATVYLKWLSAKDYDWRRELTDNDVRVVSGRDFRDPQDPDAPWGLYRVHADGSTEHLAEPVWHWARCYRLIVQSIWSDAWRKESAGHKNLALNYWWGLSSGILDVSVSPDLPTGQRTLVELLRQSVACGQLNPFAGELVSQEGLVQPEGSPRLPSEDIARMQWLNRNVVGRLPHESELSADGLEQVKVSGVIPVSASMLTAPGGASGREAGSAR